MSNASNPYDSSSSQDQRPLSFKQWGLSFAVGFVVIVSSAFTMLAFLFGTLIAFAGKDQPSPLDFATLIAGPFGKYFKIGVVGIVPVSLMLGLYSVGRIIRVQKNLLEASTRRHDLLQQLESIRQSQKSSVTTGPKQPETTP